MKEEQKFKGAGLNALIQVLKERYGEAEYTKMVSRCSPDVKRYVNRMSVFFKTRQIFPVDAFQFFSRISVTIEYDQTV